MLLFSSVNAELFQNMLFSLVVLTTLIVQSIFSTGILLVPKADEHPLEPYFSKLESSAIYPRGNYLSVIRGLLFKRQLTCPLGYGLCRNGNGCCPTGYSCCAGTIFKPSSYEHILISHFPLPTDGGCCRSGWDLSLARCLLTVYNY